MNHLIDRLLGGVRSVIRDGDNAGPGRSRYSDFVTGVESYMDEIVDTSVGLTFKPRRTIRKMMGSAEEGHDWGRTARTAGNIGMRGAEGLYGAAAGLGRGLMRGLNMMGGGRGVAAGLGMTGASILGGGMRALGGIELGARTLLTGGIGNPRDALEAYLPGWRRYGWEDVRKYGVNPRIPRRYIAAKAVHGLIAGLEEAVNPMIAPPSMYVEAGGQVRHRNDMGTGGAYGQQLLGKNSLLSGFSQMSQAQKFALLDAVI